MDLIKAIISENTQLVKLFLENGENPDKNNVCWMSPLILATGRNNLTIVKLLLEHGANPNVENEYMMTPLMIASIYDYRKIIKVLINAGADCDIINSLGNTAFDYKSGKFIQKYLDSKEHEIILK